MSNDVQYHQGLVDILPGASHCVNIEWDTSTSEISVESEGEEEHHDTKSSRKTPRKWHPAGRPARSRGVAPGQAAHVYGRLQAVGVGGSR